MKTRIAFFAFVMVLGAAASAAAQDHPFVVYEKALLARPMPAAVKEYCDGKAGIESSPGYKACRVTRLFLADINANKDQGYPPLTDITYASDAETDKLLDRMAKYGG